MTTLDVIRKRDQLHALLDQLPSDKLDEIRTILEAIGHSISVSIADAPFEEEDLSPATIAALEEATASLRRGEGIPHEDILKEFGFTR